VAAGGGRPPPPRPRLSRPEATTSWTEAGTPLPAPARCGTKPTRSHCLNRASGVPKSRASPVVRGHSPSMARTRVDFPEPLAPITATHSPGRTATSMWRSTGRPAMATAPSAISTTGAGGWDVLNSRSPPGGPAGSCA
jgi:hypothetical protein